MHPRPSRPAPAATASPTVASRAAGAPTRPAAPNPVPDARFGAVAQPEAANRSSQVEYVGLGPSKPTDPVGATLSWTNTDGEPHTAATHDRATASEALDAGDRFAFAFDLPESHNGPTERCKGVSVASRVDDRESPGQTAIVDSTLGQVRRGNED